MRQGMAIARRPEVVRTALRFSLVVGPLLVVINHGDGLFSGAMTQADWLKSLLTMIVPYAVSTLSSISACRSCEEETADAPDDLRPPRRR
ncbi:MAG: hypothetical protein D6682_00565 [Zetaproteobacteria bacterium]|nr:MAG: hypothetical protein D6682_00565 [Zetaproteobacteria bacterium]